MSHAQSIHLDPAIRDWVLFPIMLVMILVGLLRHYATVFMSSPPKTTLASVIEGAALTKARILRSSSGILTPSGFQRRVEFLVQGFNEKKYLKIKDEHEQVNPMDPAAMEGMTSMMMKNMTMFIPQTIIMSWITYFFSGFIVVKLPFPLTVRFKAMLQRGIETNDMDVSWVSSLSWYFLNLFGLKSIYTLILDDPSAAGGMGDMQQMAQVQTPPMQQPKDVINIFKSEKEFLELMKHEWLLEDVETRLLKKHFGGSTSDQDLQEKKDN